MPGYVLLYTLDSKMNPADRKFRDIASFRVKRLHPDPERDWRTMTPAEWAQHLVSLREQQADIIDAAHQQNETEPLQQSWLVATVDDDGIPF